MKINSLSMPPLLLALDFGGTKHAAAVLDLETLSQPEDQQATGAREPSKAPGIWQAYERVFLPPGAEARDGIQSLFNLARVLLGGESPASIGVSFGGPVDAVTGTVRLSHHVPGWENTPLSTILQEEFGAPAQVDNDANAAALGEHRFGAGRGFSSLMYITVSTGVGGGWILDDRLWRGADGMAGEFGHIVVDPDGPACVCGKRGCVESLASGPCMAQIARKILEDQDLNEPDRGQTLLFVSGGDPSAITGQVLNQAAEQGDELARQVLEKGAWALGVGIGNTANLMNPQRFILGGGVAKSGRFFWDAVHKAARETALPEVRFEVVPAELGDDAPLWGAIALAEDCLT